MQLVLVLAGLSLSVGGSTQTVGRQSFFVGPADIFVIEGWQVTCSDVMADDTTCRGDEQADGVTARFIFTRRVMKLWITTTCGGHPTRPVYLDRRRSPELYFSNRAAMIEALSRAAFECRSSSTTLANTFNRIYPVLSKLVD